jgi:Flp pilus assembly protein TadD
MIGRWIRFAAGVTAMLFLAGGASYAAAQNGTLTGRVTDAERRMTDRDGKPIPPARPKDQSDPDLGLPEAVVTLELTGDKPRKFSVIADAFGEWYKSGLPPGTYDISVRREWIDPVAGRATKQVVFIAKMQGVVLKPGEKTRVPNIGALTEEAIAAGRRAPVTSETALPPGTTSDPEVAALSQQVNAALKAGNNEEALAKLLELVEKFEGCGPCYVTLGQVHARLKDEKAAEAAYLKSIEIDPKNPDPYNQLAVIYHARSEFEPAAKMAMEANKLLDASAAGSDPVSLMNLGTILFDAGRVEESADTYQRVVKLNPSHAMAQFRLGLAIFSAASSGTSKYKLTDAKAPLEAYLKLEPKGVNAQSAKELLAAIK